MEAVTLTHPTLPPHNLPTKGLPAEDKKKQQRSGIGEHEGFKDRDFLPKYGYGLSSSVFDEKKSFNLFYKQYSFHSSIASQTTSS